MAREREDRETPADKARFLAGLVEETRGGADAIRVVAEPKKWQFPERYEARAALQDNYLAVYLPPHLLEEFTRRHMLISPGSGDRVSAAWGGQVKAYLKQEVAEPFLQHYGELDIPENPLIRLIRSYLDVQAIGLCHTNQLVEEGSEDTISYLVMGAKRESDFKDVLARFGGDPTQYEISSSFGRQESLLVMPIRRSMADAIVRSHGAEIRELPSDSFLDQPPSRQTIRHIQDLAAQQGDFAPLPEIAAPTATAAPKPVTATPPKPLAEFMQQIRPALRNIVRHEHIDGSHAIILHCEGSRELHYTIQEMANPAKCAPPVTISGQHNQYSIRECYATLKPYLDGVPEDTYYQSISPALLGKDPVVVGTVYNEKRKRLINVKREFVIDDLQIAQIGEGEQAQYWLVVRSDHMLRARGLAGDLRITQVDAMRPLTAPEEIPALLALRLGRRNGVDTGAAIVRRLLADEDLELAAPTLYDSFDGLTQAVRAAAEVTSQATPEKAATKPDKKWTRHIRPPAELAAIREAAAHEIFAGDIERCWLTVAPPSARHADDPASHETAVIGLCVPQEKSKNFAKAMELHARRMPEWTFGSIGPVVKARVEGNKRFDLYALKLPTADAAMLAGRRNGDSVRPRGASEFMLESTIHRLIRQELAAGEVVVASTVKRDARKEAWANLARVAREGAIDVLEVRYDRAAMDRDAAELRRRLEGVRDVLNAPFRTRELLSAHRNEPLQGGAGLIRSRVDRVFKLFGTYVAAQSTRRAKSSGPIEKGIGESLGALGQYQDWLKKHAGADGKAVLPHLLLRDPPGNVLRDLALVASTRVRGKKGKRKIPLFPIERSEFRMPDGSRIYAVPVNPEFFAALEEQGAKLIRGHLPVVEGTALERHLSERYAAPEPEALPPLSELTEARIRKTRAGLCKDDLSHLRARAVYAELRGDHAFQDIDEGMERIGRQPVLLLNIRDRSDWSQYLRHFVAQLESADLLAARRYYIDLPEQRPLQALKDRVRGDEAAQELLISAIQAVGKLLEEDTLPEEFDSWRRKAMPLYEACVRGEIPDHALRVETMLHPLINDETTPPASYLEGLKTVLESVHDQLGARILADTDAQHPLKERIALAHRGLHIRGLAREDDAPLFYLPTEDGGMHGMSMEDFSEYVAEHFARSATNLDPTPLRPILYLNLQPGRESHGVGDDALADKFRTLADSGRNEPSPRQDRGVHTRLVMREDRKGNATPSRVTKTLDDVLLPAELWEIGRHYFGGLAAGRA